MIYRWRTGSRISIYPLCFFSFSLSLSLSTGVCVLLSPKCAVLLSFTFRVDFLNRPVASTARLTWKSLVLRVFWGTLLIGSGGLSLIHTAANINHASFARP